MSTAQRAIQRIVDNMYKDRILHLTSMEPTPSLLAAESHQRAVDRWMVFMLISHVWHYFVPEPRQLADLQRISLSVRQPAKVWFVDGENDVDFHAIVPNGTALIRVNVKPEFPGSWTSRLPRETGIFFTSRSLSDDARLVTRYHAGGNLTGPLVAREGSHECRVVTRFYRPAGGPTAVAFSAVVPR